jgi:tetratricopeptide (TPR) repeat protein
VAAHLVAAGKLVDDDPELAYAHAEAARRRAARLPIVREAAAETAYAAGHYDTALSEFRALRRMTGTDDYLPVMADCERALGRPQAALKLAKESRHHNLDPALQVEMIIVESGARADLGQEAEALRLLERTVTTFSSTAEAARAPKMRLRYAYADALLRSGNEPEARDWFAAAATLDREFETDAGSRVTELDGITIDFDDSDQADEDDESETGQGPDGKEFEDPEIAEGRRDRP